MATHDTAQRDAQLERDYGVFREKGDPAALGRVFDAAAPELLRVAGYLTPDPHLAEDAVQATFLVAIRKHDMFEEGQRVMPWLLGVLAHRVRSHRRAAKRRPEAERLDPPRVLDPLSAAEESELSAAVASAISRLPEAYQPVMRLSLEHGLAAQEIAVVLSRPRGTVRSQLSRGMDMLRQLLPAGFAAAAGGASLLLPSRLAAMRRDVLSQVTPMETVASQVMWGGLTLGVAGVFAVGLLVLGMIAWSILRGDEEFWGPKPRTAGVPYEVLVPEALGESAGSEPARRQSVDDSGGSGVRIALVDPDGAPVMGTQVLLYPDTPRGLLEARWRTTDREGVASFGEVPAGAYEVIGLLGGARSIALRGAELDEELAVSEGLDVRGRVVDANGSPVADAEIHVSLAGQRREIGAVATRTDVRGRFALAGLRRGRGLSAWARGHAPSVLHRVQGEPGAEIEVTLRCVDAAGVVRGVVRDEAGRPVSGAVVQLGEAETEDGARPSVVVRTDSAGQFVHAHVAPGSSTLWIGSPAHAAHAQVVKVAAHQTTEVDVSLQPGGSVTGHVRNERGEPQARARVRVEMTQLAAELLPAPAWAYPTTPCDGDGRYVLDGLVPGPTQLLAMRPMLVRDGYRVVGSPILPLRSGASMCWDVRFGELLAWEATLVDAYGRPLAGWDVLLSVVEPDDMSRIFPATTDARGGFRVSTPRADAYELRVREPGAAAREPVLVRDDLRWQKRVQVVVPDGCRATASLSGILLAETGRPMAGADLVVAWNREEGWQEVVTLAVPADGNFSVGPLPPGFYAVGLASEDEPAWLAEIDLAAGEAADLGVLRQS